MTAAVKGPPATKAAKKPSPAKVAHPTPTVFTLPAEHWWTAIGEGGRSAGQGTWTPAAYNSVHVTIDEAGKGAVQSTDRFTISRQLVDFSAGWSDFKSTGPGFAVSVPRSFLVRAQRIIPAGVRGLPTIVTVTVTPDVAGDPEQEGRIRFDWTVGHETGSITEQLVGFEWVSKITGILESALLPEVPGGASLPPLAIERLDVFTRAVGRRQTGRSTPIVLIPHGSGQPVGVRRPEVDGWSGALMPMHDSVAEVSS